MNVNIHKTAIVEDGAEIGEGTEVGPFSIIGKNVRIGKNVKIASNVVIRGNVEIGDSCDVYEFCVLGGKPQHTKHFENGTTLKIGKNNIIKEYVSINIGTPETNHGTLIGDNCFIMNHTHFGHDCVLGNEVTAAPGSVFGGHVEIEDFAFISGLVAIHQRCKVGRYAMIGGCSKVVDNILPFALSGGNPCVISSLNKLGLTRRGFTKQQILEIYRIYKFLYSTKNKSMKEKGLMLLDEFNNSAYANEINEFIKTSKREIAKHRKYEK